VKTIIVTKENCEAVAGELVEKLFNKPLRVVSFFRGKGFSGEPKAIPAVLKLLSGLKILEFIEKEEDGKTVLGKSKHWHIFYFIAQKN